MKILKSKSMLQMVIITVSLCIFPATPVKAQFFKKLKNTVKEAVENKLDEKAKKATENTVDKILDTSEKEAKNSKEEQENTSGFPQGIKGLEDIGNAKYEKSYTFSTTVTMQMETSEKKIETTPPMKVEYSFGKDAVAYFIKNEDMDMISIIDLGNKSILMLSPTKKSGNILPLSLLNAFGKGKKQDLDYKIKKTGLSKKIKGYTCYQYVHTDKDSKQEMWLAPSLNFLTNSYIKELSKISKSNKNPYQGLNGDEGFPLEIIFYTNHIAKEKITVTDINKNPKTIVTSDYNIGNK